MAMLLYRFNDAADFPLLETETTVCGPVEVGIEGHGDDAFLRVVVQRQPNDPSKLSVVIGLPLLAIDGNPLQLLLDVLDAGSDSPHAQEAAPELFLEAGDARGWGFSYSFGRVCFSGWRTCAVDARMPFEYWGSRKTDGTPGIVPPLQPFQLRLMMSQACRAVDIGFGSLNISGDVRLAPPGITGADQP